MLFICLLFSYFSFVYISFSFFFLFCFLFFFQLTLSEILTFSRFKQNFSRISNNSSNISDRIKQYQSQTNFEKYRESSKNIEKSSKNARKFEVKSMYISIIINQNHVSYCKSSQKSKIICTSKCTCDEYQTMCVKNPKISDQSVKFSSFTVRYQVQVSK